MFCYTWVLVVPVMGVSDKKSASANVNVCLSVLSSGGCNLYAFLATAINNLNGVILYGQKIHVTLSKHAQVQMPQAGSNVRS